MDKHYKHDKILNDYQKYKNNQLKINEKKVLSINEKFNILKSRKLSLNFKKIFK